LVLLFLSGLQVLAVALNFSFNLMNGFVQPYPSMPVYMKWLNRIVPVTWALYGLVGSQLCWDDTPVVGAAGKLEGLTVSEFIAAQFGYYPYMVKWTPLILSAYIVVLRVASILVLKYVNFLRR
jgi:hypothetical protein